MLIWCTFFQAQRERFKQRNEELEEEAGRLTSQVDLLQTEVKDLRNDNVKLYEKIRFLQGFQVTKRRFLSNFKHVVDFQFELPSGPRRRRGRQQLP